MPRAFILTLGCPKNEADSDSFSACLVAAGWEITEDPACADLLLLNTCAFIEPAVEESVDAIGQALEWKSAEASRKLVLAGCLPGRFSDDGSGGLSDIDLVIGPSDTGGLLEWLGIPCGTGPGVLGRGHVRYLKISEGCSNDCAYCTIPLIRGPRRDRSPDELLAEAGRLVEQGAREIGIVGQDTGAWTGTGGIRRMLSKLALDHPDVWFRLYYVHPAHTVPDLTGLIADLPNLMPYIDMPVQHCSDRILRRMGRGYGRRELEAVFSEFDTSPVRISVRTTVIVGYPGETDEDFLELKHFLEDHASIRNIAAFPYWSEEGTLEHSRAGTDEMVPPATVQSRLSMIGDTADMHYRTWGEMLEDTVIEVMVDSPSTGHTKYDAPSVDGTCFLETSAPGGTVVRCRITDSEGPDLTGEVVD